jgi:hypothetical protein
MLIFHKKWLHTDASVLQESLTTLKMQYEKNKNFLQILRDERQDTERIQYQSSFLIFCTARHKKQLKFNSLNFQR